MPQWKTPFYELTDSAGVRVKFDVTTSISASLKANPVITKFLLRFLTSRDLSSVVDFGAGALRHTLPLFNAGLQVCAVEFEQAFQREVAGKKLNRYKSKQVIGPYDFVADKRRFDAVILTYVLQVMPRPDERRFLLRLLYDKLKRDGYLLYMSRYGQITPEDYKHPIGDGYFRYPDRDYHSFYREFETDETHEMMAKFGFHRLRSLSKRGTDQIFLYGKGKATFV